MMIEITRFYVGSQMEAKMMLNTDYIMKVEPCPDPNKAKTLIVFDSGLMSEGPSLIYTNESYATIKGKLTFQRNNTPKKRGSKS